MKISMRLISLLFAVLIPFGSVSAITISVDSLLNRTPLDISNYPITQGWNTSAYYNQVQVTLAAGTYSFAIVSGAWNPWGTQQTGCGLDGRCTTGWNTVVSYDRGIGSTSTPIFFYGAYWATPQLALANAKLFPAYQATFLSQTTLRFYIADTVYDQISSPWINQGSVTLSINPIIAPVPEPETYAMLIAGLGLIGVIDRRRKQNALSQI